MCFFVSVSICVCFECVPGTSACLFLCVYTCVRMPLARLSAEGGGPQVLCSFGLTQWRGETGLGACVCPALGGRKGLGRSEQRGPRWGWGKSQLGGAGGKLRQPSRGRQEGSDMRRAGQRGVWAWLASFHKKTIKPAKTNGGGEGAGPAPPPIPPPPAALPAHPLKYGCSGCY